MNLVLLVTQEDFYLETNGDIKIDGASSEDLDRRCRSSAYRGPVDGGAYLLVHHNDFKPINELIHINGKESVSNILPVCR